MNTLNGIADKHERELIAPPSPVNRIESITVSQYGGHLFNDDVGPCASVSFDGYTETRALSCLVSASPIVKIRNIKCDTIPKLLFHQYYTCPTGPHSLAGCGESRGLWTMAEGSKRSSRPQIIDHRSSISAPATGPCSRWRRSFTEGLSSYGCMQQFRIHLTT